MDKVCLVSHQGALHGANRGLLALIDGIRQSDSSDRFSPHVIVPEEGPIVDELRKRRVPTAVTPFSWSAHGGDISFLQRLRNLVARVRGRQPGLTSVVDQINEWDIDLIHTNTLVVDVGHYASSGLGIPHVWYIREFANGDHGLYPDPGWHIYARRIAASDCTITISKAVASHLCRYRTISNLEIVYSGVVVEAQKENIFERCRTGVISGESPLFMIIGRVEPSEGQDVAVRALMKLRKSHPHARLAIVGDGERGWIEQVIEEEGAEEAVDLWGYVDGPWEAYAQADVALTCSESEAMGRVTVEAMIAGTPVIGRDHAGTSELIQHGVTGRLYDRTADDLATEMKWILSHPTEAEEISENAWECASHQFTNEKCAEDVMKVWARALKNRE